MRKRVLIKDQIINLMKDVTDQNPVTIQWLADQIGAPYSSVSAQLRTLCVDGEVKYAPTGDTNGRVYYKIETDNPCDVVAKIIQERKFVTIPKFNLAFDNNVTTLTIDGGVDKVVVIVNGVTHVIG